VDEARWDGVGAAPRATDSVAAVLLRLGVNVPPPRPRTSSGSPRPSSRSGRPPRAWCVGQQRWIPRGAGVFLLMQGSASGLIGRGFVIRRPFLAAQLDRPGTVAQHLVVEWTSVLPVSDRVPVELLHSEVPQFDWCRTGGPALGMDAATAERISLVWTSWVSDTIHAAARSARIMAGAGTNPGDAIGASSSSRRP
jgi:hypothetical protein